MTWSLQTDGTYKRPLVYLEHLYLLLLLGGGGNHIQLTGAVAIETTYVDIAERLKKAWIAIHYKYPHVASSVVGVDYVYTPLKTQEGIDEWLGETFIVSDATHPSEITSNHVLRPILYYLPKANNIVLQSHHHSLDSIGCTVFFNELLLHAAENKSYDILNLDSNRLTLPLHVATGHELEDNEQADKLIERYGQTVPWVGGGSYETERPLHGTTNQRVFSEEETKDIISKVKASGHTVTSAAHAAFIEALHEVESSLLGDAAPKNFGSLAFINLRPFVQDNHPFTPVNMCLPVFYTLEGTQEDRSRRSKKLFRELKKSFYEGISTDSVPLDNPFKHQFGLGTNLLKPWVNSNPPNDNMSMTSSFGDLDQHLTFDATQLHVTDFWFQNHMNSAMVLLSIWTFKKKLVFSIDYNEHYHDDAEIEQLQVKIVEKLYEIVAECNES